MSGSLDDAPVPATAVFDRHVDVLAAIADAEQAPRFTDLLAQTRLPKATLHRVLAALERNGLARRGTGGAWQAGLRLVGFAHRAWAGFDLRVAAADELTQLRDATRETVRLAVLEGASMLYLDQRDSLEDVRLRLGIGGRGPAYCSGTGKAVLAFLPAEVRAAVLQATPPTRHTPATLVDRASLEADLAATRLRGYSLDEGEQVADIRSLGAPILRPDGGVAGAISLTVPSYRMSRDALLAVAPKVIAAAQRIAARLPPE